VPAAGGVTTIVDMPCTSLPPVTTTDNFNMKMRAIAPKAYVDYALWGGTTHSFIDSGAYRRLLPELRELGVVGIKAYTISGMQTYPRLDTRQMVMLFEAARDCNMLVAVHAEDYFLASYYSEKIIREGRTDPLAYKDGRTYDAEPLAISTVLALARRALNPYRRKAPHRKECLVRRTLHLLHESGPRVRITTAHWRAMPTAF